MSDQLRPEDLDAFAQSYDIPGAVRELPPKPSKGNSFDFGSIVVQSHEDFARLPESQKQLLRNMKQGIQYTPEAAASFVESFNQKQLEQSTPEARARAEKAALDLKAAEAEARAKANESAAGRARITSVLDTINKLEPNIDNLVGPLAPAAQMKDKWINPDIYAQRFDLANTTKNDVLEAAKYVKPLSNDERKFLEDMFPKIDDPAPVWKNYFDRTRRMLGAGLGDAAPAPAPANQSMTQPAAAPAAERIIRGQRWLLNPQTGKYYVAPGQ